MHPMNYDYYIPDFEVLLNRSPTPDAQLRRVITSVSLTTGLEGADRVEMVIANQARMWLDKRELATRVPFTLKMGYLPGKLVHMFGGEITGVAASFPSSGVPQLTISAQDARHRLKEGRQAGWHANPQRDSNEPKADDALISEVAGKYELQARQDPIVGKLVEIVEAAAQVGLAGDADSKQKAVRQQMSETDYDLLRRISRERGLEMYIDHSDPNGSKVLRFLFPPSHITSELDLEYGISLIDFTPRESEVGQVKSVSANMRVSASGDQYGVTLEVNEKLSELTVKVIKGSVPSKKSDSAVVLDEPLTPATAPRRLLGELLTRTNSRLTGSGSTAGDTRIRSGTVLCLKGLGVRFGGYYRVTSATHTLDTGGYKTRFEVRKEIGLNDVAAESQKATPIRKPAPATS